MGDMWGSRAPILQEEGSRLVPTNGYKHRIYLVFFVVSNMRRWGLDWMWLPLPGCRNRITDGYPELCSPQFCQDTCGQARQEFINLNLPVDKLWKKYFVGKGLFARQNGVERHHAGVVQIQCAWGVPNVSAYQGRRRSSLEG